MSAPDDADVIHRDAAADWGGATGAPDKCVLQLDWRNCNALSHGLEPIDYTVCLCQRRHGAPCPPACRCSSGPGPDHGSCSGLGLRTAAWAADPIRAGTNV